MPDRTREERRQRVVIIGAGFGGLAAALGPEDGRFDVTVVDRHNHHLFQPLLYQVATAGLSPADIASPIRSILRTAATPGSSSPKSARVEAATIVWGAGVMASPAGAWLGARTDRAGRVQVSSDLSLPGRPEVFVIGDTAHALDEERRPLPGIAPVAKQQGRYVAALLAARAEGRELLPFRYRDRGLLATVGRKQAVAELGGLRLAGFSAWLLWSLAHVYFLIGFRNRLSVALNWSWSYVTFQRGTRLITGLSGTRMIEADRP